MGRWKSSEWTSVHSQGSFARYSESIPMAHAAAAAAQQAVGLTGYSPWFHRDGEFDGNGRHSSASHDHRHGGVGASA